MKRNTFILCAVFLLFMFATGTGLAAEPVSSANDAQPAYNIFPTENNISIYKEWIIEFNSVLSADSVTTDTICVLDHNGGRVTVFPEIMPGGKSVKVKPPAGGYAYNAKYTLVIEGVKSHDQKSLSRPVKKDFYTEASAEPIIIGTESKIIDNPNTSNTLGYQNKASVEIPANTVASGTVVTIKEISGAKRHEFNDLQTMGTYDITAGSTKTFANYLTLRFKFDPSALQDEYEAADQLVVAYLDKEKNRWVETEFSVDKSNHELVVSTNHLTLWSVFGIGEDIVVTSAPGFKIYFNQNLNAPKLGPLTGNELIFDFVTHVRNSLWDANAKYKAYGGTGFKLPAMTKVYVDDWGHDKTAEWGWFSKNIEIPIQYDNLLELQHDSAHELFHAVQNEYLSFVTMHMNRWWMEATADYAAAAIVGTNKYPAIDESYLQKSMGTTDSVHEYQSAHFIDHLVRYKNVDFLKLWKYTTAAWSTDMIATIDGYLQQEMGTSSQECYRDFARYLIFSANSPVAGNSTPWKTPYEMAMQTEMPLTTKILDKRGFSLSKYTAQLWGIKPEIGSSAASRSLILELDEDLPGGVYADVFVLYDNQWATGQPVPVATLQKAGEPAVVTIMPGQLLFVLVSNGSNDSSFVAIRVKELNFAVTPAEMVGQTGQVYEFSVKAQNIPKNHYMVKFEWDFGDGETKNEDNLSVGSSTAIVQDSGVEITINHSYMQAGSYILRVKMFDLEQNIIAEAVAAINIPEQEVAVSILPPRIVIYELQGGTTEATHGFEAVPTPAGTYRFEWDFGDGSPLLSYTGMSSIMSHIYSGAGTYKPRVELYGLGGKLLAEDSISVILEVASEDQVVAIPDAGLQSAIRSKLNKPTDDILASDMASLVELDAMDRNIKNLTGLEYAVNLEILWLHFNDISDLSPLAGLTNLQHLYLNSNFQISDLSPLSGLINLKTLRVHCDDTFWAGYGHINDLTPIAGLVNLEHLDMCGHQISDLTPLAGMSKLKELWLRYNQITDIDVLSNMANLDTLIISHNKINNISSLSGLTNLYDIEIMGNQISDLTPLSGLTNLEWLQLNDNLIQDIEPVSNLTRLISLSLNNNQITDISALNSLTSLEYLYLKGNPLDISTGSEARKLIEWFTANGCDVEY